MGQHARRIILHRTICYTLDLEADHDGVAPRKAYEAIARIDRFLDLIGDLELPVTCFATGLVLRDHPETVERLLAAGFDLQLHSYSHLPPDERSGAEEVERGYHAYVERLGHPPVGYRGPFGIMGEEELGALKRFGFHYHSSEYPTRLAPYGGSRLPRPNGPYRWRNGLLEIPFTVVPGLRLPIGMSFLQAFGLPTYRLLFRLLGLPDFINFVFHLHDLFNTDAYHSLPLVWKAYYLRNRLKGEPLRDFERTVHYFEGLGFRPLYLTRFAEQVRGQKSPVPEPA